MRSMLAAAVAVIVTSLAAYAQPLTGTLHIDGAESLPYACGEPLPVESEARRFVFAGPDGTFHIGVIAPEATRVTCNGGGAIELRRRSNKGISASTVQLSDGGGNAWTLDVRDMPPSRPIVIHAPHGTYRLRAEASHALPFETTVSVGETPVQMPIALDPLPSLSGRVRARDGGEPVTGAIVTTDRGDEAVTDAGGSFTIDLDPEKWPLKLEIAAAGYGLATVAVPQPRVSATLEDIYLVTGGAVTVEVQQSEPGRLVELELWTLQDHGRTLGSMVATRAVADAEQTTPVRFEGIEPGRYLVLAKGRESSERLAEPVDVEEGLDSRVTLTIAPFRLRLRIEMDGAGVGANVVLTQRDLHWSGTFSTSEEGDADVPLWQGGRFRAIVAGAALTPSSHRRDLPEGDDAQWVIDVAAHEIAGIVIDGSTNEPVPAASLVLATKSADGHELSVRAKADQHGRFRFAPATHGLHTLKAAAGGYGVMEMTYPFEEPERRRELVVRLERAATTRLSVVDERGMPIAGAHVLEFRDLTPVGRGTTDASGTIPVMLVDGDARDVWVIPRDGSFGVVRLASGLEKATLTIGRGTSSIVLRTESDSGAPIGGVAVVVRYNGRVLPYEVVNALATHHGSVTRANADGRMLFRHMPPGLYEFWPVFSPAELRKVAAGSGPPAPVRLAATPGENVALLTFASDGH